MRRGPKKTPAKKKVVAPIPADEYICSMCGSSYKARSARYFPRSYGSPLWAGYDGYIPVCKSCLETPVSYTHLYTEYQFADDQSAANFYEEGILPDDFPSLYANEYVFLYSSDAALIDKRKWNGSELKIVNSMPIRTEWMGKVAPRNKEQQIALDLLDVYKRQNVRCGHVLVNGNYSTLCGNPIEMLQASIGQFHGESIVGVGQIHSHRFEYDKTILGSRSPHVTMGNVWLTRNVENPVIDDYVNLTNEIVCINSIGENLLMRLSGADR